MNPLCALYTVRDRYYDICPMHDDLQQISQLTLHTSAKIASTLLSIIFSPFFLSRVAPLLLASDRCSFITLFAVACLFTCDVLRFELAVFVSRLCELCQARHEMPYRILIKKTHPRHPFGWKKVICQFPGTTCFAISTCSSQIVSLFLVRAQGHKLHLQYCIILQAVVPCCCSCVVKTERLSLFQVFF